MRRLAPDAAVQAVEQLLNSTWSWTADDLDTAMTAAGLTAPEADDDMSYRFEHPALPDVFGIVATLADGKTVLEVSVTLTELIDEFDRAALAELDDAFDDYEAHFTDEFGTPDERPKKGRTNWDRGENILELRDLGIAVVLAVIHKESRRQRDNG